MIISSFWNIEYRSEAHNPAWAHSKRALLSRMLSIKKYAVHRRHMIGELKIGVLVFAQQLSRTR